ncbi:MAG: isocitrate lyase/phosphoenolpyruvate mutase family protein [Armatimonadota bacterium]
MRKSEKLRKMLNDPDKLITVIGAHDGLGAKLGEKAGFDALWSSGLEISTSYAVPDANILTMTQYLERATEMNNASFLPVIADCDTGYGNSNNVIYMVKSFESAGIAAVTIEDKLFPKINSFIPGRQELAPIAEFVGKIMAAKNAQESKDFMVFARTEALIAGWGIEEALKRANDYANAGADGILIHSKSGKSDEVFEFLKRWQREVPVIVVPTTYYNVTRDELKSAGAKMVIYANHGLRAQIKAAEDTYKQIIAEGTTKGVEKKIAPLAQIFELQGMTELKEKEKEYLKTGTESCKVIIPAAGKPVYQECMEDLVKDYPVCMLDVNGKSLLQRNLETLNKLNIFDIDVVVGYQKERISLDGTKVGVNFIYNDEFDKTHIMRSLMLSKETTPPDKVIICYSDILFGSEIIEKLKNSNRDIVLVINKADRLSQFKDNKLDLVTAKKDPLSAKRTIGNFRDNEVLAIGKNIPKDKSQYEFIGIAAFSARGYKQFKETYQKARSKYNGNKFYEAQNIDKASFTDLIQEMIAEGIKIDALEVDSDWIEIHSFENYKQACALLKE